MSVAAGVILTFLQKLFLGSPSATPAGTGLQIGNGAILVSAVGAFFAIPETFSVVLDKNSLAFIGVLGWFVLEMNRRAKVQ